VDRPLAERCASACEKGRRRSNQDAVLAAVLRGGQELLAVADGMGGHAAGAVASRRALELLREAIEAGAELPAAARAANAALFEEAGTQPERDGMGTTLVALLRDGPRYVIVNVGDSRAYRIDHDGIRQITRDHSFLVEAVASSGMSAEQAAASPWRNAVTRALGMDAAVEVDCFGPFDAREPHAVLLCTDGLHRALPDEHLMSAVAAPAQPHDIVRALAAAAYEAGSDDNISAVVARFGVVDLQPLAVPAAASSAPSAPSAPSVASGAGAQVRQLPGSMAAAALMQAGWSHSHERRGRRSTRRAVQRWLQRQRGRRLRFADNVLFVLALTAVIAMALLIVTR
jgi:PPM family protein phosphatase